MSRISHACSYTVCARVPYSATIKVNNQAYKGATEATVFGPVFVEDSPAIELGEDMTFGAPGEPCWVEGTVTDTDGTPLAGAVIEVWEADEDGLYDVQYDAGKRAARAHLFSAADGTYRFWGLTPTPYPIRTTDPSARCSTRSAAHRCAPPTCTSWSPTRARARW